MMESALERKIAELKPGDHLCLIYEDSAERLAAVVPFVKAGLDRGECCVYIADASPLGDLAAAGVEVLRHLERGALVWLTPHDLARTGKAADPEAMIDLIRRTLERARAAGFVGLRVTGEMTWGLGSGDGSNRLLETEARLSRFLADNPALALCPYHRPRVPPAVLRAHPVVILDRQVCSNPHYEPPEMLAGQASETDRVAWMLGSLQELHWAEAELREREERYRRLVEDSHGLICTHDLAGTLLSVNAAAAALLGYRPDEMVGRNLAEFLAPSAQHLFDEYLACVRQAPAYSGLLRVVTRDGEERIWVCRNVRIDGSKGQSYVLGHAQDITDRERLTKARHQTTLSLLQATLDLTADGLLVMDQTGKIVRFNRKFAEMWRIPKPILASQDHALALNCSLEQVEDAAGFLSRLQELCSHPEAEGMDVLQLKDGRIFERYSQPRRVGRKFVGRVFSCRDITERKRAEEALREAEHRYRTLFEQLPGGIVVIDPQTALPIEFNEAAHRQLGYSREEFAQLRISDYEAAETPEETQAHIEKILREGRDNVETRHRTKPGDIRDVLVTAQMIELSGRPVIHSIFHDITDRKQAEKALHASEARYQSLFNGVPVGLYRTTPGGQFLDANQALVELLGYPDREALLAINAVAVYVITEDRKRWQALMEREGVVRGFEMQLRRYDGTVIWVEDNARVVRDADGRVLSYEGSDQDITERKQAEELRREMHVALANAMPGISRLDPEGRYVTVNDMYARMTGYEPGEMIGMDWARTVHPEDRGIALAAYQRMVTEGKAECEARAVRKDEFVFHKHVLMVKRVNQEGNFIGHHCFMRDISERNQVESALRQSEERYRDLVENANDIIFTCDLAWNVTSLNRAGETISGYTRNEALTMNIAKLVAPEHHDLMRHMLDRKVREGGVTTYEVDLVAKDGHRVPLEVTTRLIFKDGSPGGVQGIARDISERKRAEATRRALYQASLQVQEPLGLQDRLDRLLQTVQTVLNLDRVHILLADPGGRMLESVASMGVEDSLEGVRIPIGPEGGMVAQAYRTQQTIVWDGQHPVPDALRLKPPYDRIAAFRSRAFTLVPLVVQGRAIGVLGADRKHTHRPLDPATLELLQLFATQAALAIEQAQTFERVQGHSAALKRFYEASGQVYRFVTLDETLHAITKAAVEACGSASGNLILFDDAARISQFIIWDPRGALTPETINVRPDGLSRKVLATGHLELIPDFAQEPPGTINPVPLLAGCRAAACVPLPLQSGKGLLWVHYNAPHPFSQEEVALLQAFAQQAAVAIQKARLFEEVEAGRQRLETMSRQLVAVQEAERLHLARELHDEIGQLLTAVKINLNAMERAGSNAEHAARLEESIGIVDRLLQQVRNLSLDLRPLMLDDLGLVAALRWYLDRQAQRAGFGLEVSIDPLEIRLAQEIETACFRVAQEALTNVVRHARARRVQVHVQQRVAELELLVHDDGVGFDVGPTMARATRGASVGLLGMHERVQLVGGRIEIQSAPGGGTTVLARFPLRERKAGGG